jgi:hypothetical protein
MAKLKGMYAVALADLSDLPWWAIVLVFVVAAILVLGLMAYLWGLFPRTVGSIIYAIVPTIGT